MDRISLPKYTFKEELLNSISHGIMGLLSIWGLVMIILKADTALEIVTVTIFGTTEILLYIISCIYHALSRNVSGKKVLRVLDHVNVFLLVYGTIIPIALLGIGHATGWVCFGITSFITLVGIIATCINIDKVSVFEVICHLINGWSILMYSGILLNNIGSTGVILIVIGGLLYTIGAILYGIGSHVKYMHSIFHIFCIMGTVLHYIAIYFYIL